MRPHLRGGRRLPRPSGSELLLTPLLPELPGVRITPLLPHLPNANSLVQQAFLIPNQSGSRRSILKSSTSPLSHPK